MDGALIFCKDAILRFRSDYDDLTAIPLLSVQACLENEDPLFLLKYFRHPVIIEEGTTLSHIFLAIKPWAKILGIYLDIDVMSYIDEIRKPSQAESVFDWIGIQKVTSIHRAYQHQDIKPGEDFTSYFNRERIPTKHFDIEADYTANGYKNKDKEHYSISGDIHTIKNVPVVVSDRQVVASYGYEKSNLMNRKYTGVTVNNKISYIQGRINFSFYEVMEAIFNDGLFYFSPQAANANLAMIKKMAEMLDQDEAGNQEAPMQEISGKIDDNPVDKSIAIDITEGAMDPMIEHIEAEKIYWRYIKSLCDSLSELPIRIGHIEEAMLPEYRFSNFIMEDI
ncbi:hypothetical protein [Acerihabitans arboris]|uniref:Uncharacterized protein n=1 Tax=Acerihabitans arboris TaxID=2691583 RepID=A0A845SE20_9GAMM|nr:hypothetical protein [Acerihabitans arboris]NDL61184.1 hypothetical protein [Acerihabitans arboris]